MKSRFELEEELASTIAIDLNKEIETFGNASILVSGGSTPIGLFESLSIRDIQWSKVNITLVDERFVEDKSKDQNGFLVRNHLLKNRASSASFYPMVLDLSDNEKNLMLYKKSILSIRRPFTVVVLGMGTDGHTASFFPDSSQLKMAMTDDDQDVINVRTEKSPYPRITFTYHALANSKNIYLHFYGEEKLGVLKQAKENKGFLPYPIQQFIREVDDLSIYSTL